MEERKFIRLKKEEFGIKEYIKRDLGKGKISKLDIEYTPLGEKIIVSTSKPGFIIGRKGEKINELTSVLKNRFKLENPHIEINEIENHLFDSQLVADEIALALERMGNLKFKVIAYRKLQEIINAGALGCEIRLTGKLPSERAKSWRFSEGYLKKAGEPSKEIDRAQSTALTKTGIIGIKVAIMNPKAKIYDRIDIDANIKSQINSFVPFDEDKEEKSKKKDKEGKSKKKKISKKKINKGKPLKGLELVKGQSIKESPDLKPEEDGTAMKIEEEIEDGVPQEQIDEELKDAEEEHKEKLSDEKTKKGEEIKDIKDIKDNNHLEEA